MHLIIHLPREAIIGGPVFYRWMYSIERFHTKYRERLRRTQNCEIVVNSSITSYTSARDNNPVEGNMEYYGLLTDIIELDYYRKWKVVLFRCDWADINTARGIKKDQFGFTMVNFSRLIHTGEQLVDEPYVFSSQVKQVFYSKDPTDEGEICSRDLGCLYQEGIGKKWRDHKSTLKKEYFKEDISLEEKLRNVPPGMLRYQWEDAVRFWNSKKGEDRERVGTNSRQKQKFTHTVGSKSFVCVAEAEELSSGQKVGHLQLFDITHRKKDGSPMTSEAREIMEKLKDKKTVYEAIASTNSSINFEDIDNRIITEVLGPERYGRVRFQGSGSQAQAEVQRLRDQIAQIQASTVEQISQLRAEAAAREAEQTRKYDELQLQLQSIMKMFQQSYKPPS
ncbi:hypothetical protein J1N35_045609 [Gossypium stocksii]|uniref:DUF4216 domain-containing protein n=1 Tax=Gossypium stocksii TaxID=47602 RepID=A0A9D3UBI1_9ROSI|nr:hypothetical protein J1N35_045609 [Gossypium stocksii]